MYPENELNNVVMVTNISQYDVYLHLQYPANWAFE